MIPYLATPRRTSAREWPPELMYPDECGLMEELILEDGRFAG